MSDATDTRVTVFDFLGGQAARDRWFAARTAYCDVRNGDGTKFAYQNVEGVTAATGGNPNEVDTGCVVPESGRFAAG